jgi:hypothetical protein
MHSTLQEPSQDGIPYEEVGKRALAEAEGVAAASLVDAPPRDEVSPI